MSFLDVNIEYEKKKIKSIESTPSKYISFTGYNSLKNSKDHVLADLFYNVITNKKVIDIANRYKCTINISIIYTIFKTYCKYCTIQLRQNINSFHFPNFGTFKRIDMEKRKAWIESKDILHTKRSLVFKYYSKLNDDKTREIIELKRKQWKHLDT